MNRLTQNALAAGAAPSRWQQYVRREVARNEAARRCASWVWPFVSMRVALLDGSMLGNCFVSMLTGTRRTSVTESVGERRRGRRGGARPLFKDSSATGAPVSPPLHEGDAPSVERTDEFRSRTKEARRLPNGLPRCADHNLLCLLADALPAPVNSRTQRRDSNSAGIKESARHLFQLISDAESNRDARDASDRPHLPSELGHETAEAAQRHWQNELARRINRIISLANTQADASAEPPQDLHVWPWSASVRGPTAPPELLEYLSNLSGQVALSSAGDERHRSSDDVSQERKKVSREEGRRTASANTRRWPDGADADPLNGDRSNGLKTFDNPESQRAEGMTPPAYEREGRTDAGHGARRADGSTARMEQRVFPHQENLLPSQDAQVKPSWSEFWRPLTPPEDNFDPRMENAPSTSGWARQIEPPITPPQLPPLIPQQMVGMPVLPVAAATARQRARTEDGADEDLDMLATRIKRILDEEARRHGIDV